MSHKKVHATSCRIVLLPYVKAITGNMPVTAICVELTGIENHSYIGRVYNVTASVRLFKVRTRN